VRWLCFEIMAFLAGSVACVTRVYVYLNFIMAAVIIMYIMYDLDCSEILSIAKDSRRGSSSQGMRFCYMLNYGYGY